MIANAVIATVFLKEPFRKRDLIGVITVCVGVTFVVAFAPKQDSVLDADRFYYLMSQPGAIVTLCFVVAAIIVLYFLCPKYGHKHVLWNLSQASLIGCLTVVSSKAMSTFLNLTLVGAFNPDVPFHDQVDQGKDEEECEDAGHTWMALSKDPPFEYGCVTVDDPKYDDDGELIQEGASQLTEWALYVSLVIMIATAVSQARRRRPRRGRRLCRRRCYCATPTPPPQFEP